jgi:hypothetical protein
MRLTLRTLLAYLDDTLDPTEIKTIGQKVAESDAAQELIARIKSVTRRRRLTTPPATGPGARFDPNTVAEYLDNVLPTDQVGDVEAACLGSDVHLAEIAACHQILTLVLGEPALVPPTAKQRMYALAKGKEAIPTRKPPSARKDEQHRHHDDLSDSAADIPFLLRPSTFPKWLVPVTAAGLLLVLGAVLWGALSGGGGVQHAVLPGGDTRPESRPDTRPEPRPGTGGDKPPTTGPSDRPKDPPADLPRDTGPPDRPKDPPVEPPPAGDANDLGQVVLAKDVPNFLVRRAADKDPWQLLSPQAKVPAGGSLVALPGFHGQVRTGTGVDLVLWGSLPQFLSLPLFESGVSPRPRSGDLDLDFTLDRGRVVVANRKDKGPAHVRVRFAQEVYPDEQPPRKPETWDVTLEKPGTEVGLLLLSVYTPEIPFALKNGEGPLMEMYLVVLSGEASVKIGRETFGSLEPAPSPRSIVLWNNKGAPPRGPAPMQKGDERLWDPAFPSPPPVTAEAAAMKVAMEEMIKLSGTKAPEVVAEEMVSDNNRPLAGRSLGVYCLGALDVTPKLIAVLDDESGDRPLEVRQAAIATLRHWISRRNDQDRKLYDTLVGQHFKVSDAQTVMQLLHDANPKDLQQPETWDGLIQQLNSNRPAVRELAYWQLARLVPKGRERGYYPGNDSTQRKAAIDAWKLLIPDGKLPMPPK